MSKPKVLFIGNYKETRTRELLDAFVKKYENVFDIFASGYYYGNIEETTIGKDARGSLSSSKYFYYRDTAEYAIITTLAPLYEKRKANQKLIYVTSECLMDTIEGCIGDVDAVITDNQAVWEDIQSRFDHLRVQMTDLDNAEEVIGAMSIAEDLPKDTEDYLVVTANAGGGLFMNEDGLHHVFGEIRNDAGNNIIVCSLNGADKMSTSAIPMDGSFISTCILNEFDGTVLFDTEYIRSYFLEFTGNNGIKLKAKEMKMLHDMKLKGLEKAAAAGEEASHAKNTGEYVQYRIFMDRLYEINNCSESMVSVIICRYNTPWDLMKRSIQSALNTGHDNVEVVIVDDGSEDNIEKTIFEEFHDVRVKYYYKDNEGPGPSRDYGVMRATGEYVFYLDSDDTIRPNGLPCLIAHADFFDLDMVVGKRILCDENGKPRNESLKGLYGDTYTCYYADGNKNDSFIDTMVTNKLIRRSSLIDSGIHFDRGVYEDVEYSAYLYSYFPEFHYVNVPVHNWYLYGENSTLSSTVSISNLEERIKKENSSWECYPEAIKAGRMKTILLSDFNLYLNSFYSLSEDKQRVVFAKIGEFVKTRKDYLSISSFPPKTKELTRSILEDNFDYFKYVIDRYYRSQKKQSEPYDNYVVFSFYQLYVACLYALKRKRKSRIYLCQSYVSFDTNMVYRIKQTGLFDCVSTFSHGNVQDALFDELSKRPGEDDIVIPQYLYDKYREIFRECSTADDTVFVFSDLQPYWYYIEREFRHIVKLEEEYNSFEREVSQNKIDGNWAYIQKYEGKTYPEMFCKSDKISRIIVSSKPEASHIYDGKIEISDTKKLEEETYDEISRVMLSIHDIDPSLFSGDATLLVTQPFAESGYCTKKEQKALMEKLCAPYKGTQLFVKPHDKDRINYEYLGGMVLPRKTPTAVFNYLDEKISRVISFESGAIEALDVAKEKISVIDTSTSEPADVKKAIQDYIKTDAGKSQESMSAKKRIKRKMKKMLNS